MFYNLHKREINMIPRTNLVKITKLRSANFFINIEQIYCSNINFYQINILAKYKPNSKDN